jgi:hypothetical protein
MTWQTVSGGVPPGTITHYVDDGSAVPDGWVLCDGNNGIPDLRGEFVKGQPGLVTKAVLAGRTS